MRSRLLVAASIAAVLGVGLAILAIHGSRVREDSAVRPGVLADHAIGDLPRGREVCQRPLDIDRPIQQIGLAVDTGGAPGPPLEVTVRSYPSGRALTAVRQPGTYVVGRTGFVPVTMPRHVSGGRTIEVCARNLGREPLTLVGNRSIDTSDADVGRQPLDGDWGVFFLLPQDRKRTVLQMAPDILRRATVLRPGFVTPAGFVVLGLLLVVAAPVLLWKAVVTAAADRHSD